MKFFIACREKIKKIITNFALYLGRYRIIERRYFCLLIKLVMKKLLIVLALAGVSTASMAQDSDPVQKYSVATNSFWSNWLSKLVATGTHGIQTKNMERACQQAHSKSSVQVLVLL